DVDSRCGIGRGGEERLNLGPVSLEQYDFNREPRLFLKVSAHAFPDCDDLRVVRDGAKPDGSKSHRVSPGQVKRGIPSSDLPMNSRSTSFVGAITAPACASLKKRSMPACRVNAAPPHVRIANEVTAIAVSPAAALISSTRSMVRSPGCSR